MSHEELIEENPDEKSPASTKQYYTVTLKDLPLCCPRPDQRLWDGHPRVYLPIEKTGKATCPYCDAEFSLISNHDHLPSLSSREAGESEGS